MQKSLTKYLSLSLEGHISLWRTRRETLVWLVALIIQTGTVSLWRLAGHVDTRAKTLSVHRRFERFFQYVHLDEASIAQLIAHIMGLAGKPWHLALDRTNWKFGRCHINILMLGVVHENVCIPLFWVLLDKAGNSNARERTDLMGRLNETFPDQPIASLSGDREFIGERWMKWLENQGIPFVLRLKVNMFIWKEGYVPVKLSVHARRLEKRQKCILKGTWYLGRDPEKKTTPIKVAMMRLKTGEMLIQNQNGPAHISEPLGHRNAVLLPENTRLWAGRYTYDRRPQIGNVDRHSGHRVLPRLQSRPLGCPSKTASA